MLGESHSTGSQCIQDSVTGTKVCASIGAEDGYVCLRPVEG